MKCHNCGNDIPEESVFCGICGARVEPEPDISEPIIDPVTEPVEPVIEPVEPITEPVEPATEPDEPIIIDSDEQSEGAHAEEFIINHCPHCGAVLIDGAKFCSNCGKSTAVYEWDTRGKRTRAKMIIAAILAAAVIILGVSFLMDFRSIEGEWAVENSGGGFFDMFSESYLDFDDNGTAMYYNGLFNARKYNYSYNRFTKILTLESARYGADGEESRLHVDWIDPYTITIRELNMTLYRIDDIPYAYEDDEFDDNDVVEF